MFSELIIIFYDSRLKAFPGVTWSAFVDGREEGCIFRSKFSVACPLPPKRNLLRPDGLARPTFYWSEHELLPVNVPLEETGVKNGRRVSLAFC